MLARKKSPPTVNIKILWVIKVVVSATALSIDLPMKSVHGSGSDILAHHPVHACKSSQAQHTWDRMPGPHWAHAFIFVKWCKLTSKVVVVLSLPFSSSSFFSSPPLNSYSLFLPFLFLFFNSVKAIFYILSCKTDLFHIFRHNHQTQLHWIKIYSDNDGAEWLRFALSFNTCHSPVWWIILFLQQSPPYFWFYFPQF